MNIKTLTLLILSIIPLSFFKLAGQNNKDLLLHWRFDRAFTYGELEPNTAPIRGEIYSKFDGRSAWARTRAGGGVQWRPAGLFDGAAYMDKGPRGNLHSFNPITLPENWTLSFWLKYSGDVTRVENILLFENVNKQPLVALNYKGDIQVNLYKDGNQIKGVRNRDTKLIKEKWVHIALVARSHAFDLYVNGKVSSASGYKWDKNEAFKINLFGKLGHQHHRYNGYMDDLRIYSSALNASEISHLKDPESDFYKTERLPAIPQPGLGYTAWKNNGKATFTLEGKKWFSGKNGGTTISKWEVIKKPQNSKATIENSSELLTKLTVDKAGDYKLKLTLSNEAGSSSRVVNAVAFEKDPGNTNPKLITRTIEEINPKGPEPYREERAKAIEGKTIPLLAYWDFEQSEGSQVPSVGPKSKPLALNEYTKIVDDGKFGKSLQVSAEKNFKEVDFGSFDELNDEFSVSFWFNSDHQYPKQFFQIKSNTEPYWAAGSRQHKTAPDYTMIIFKWWQYQVPIKLPNTWNHIVFTYSKKFRNLKKLYINGNLEALINEPYNEKASGDPKLVLGALSGKLDDVALYGKTLNNEEVWAIFNAQTGASEIKKRIKDDPYSSMHYRKSFVEEKFPDPEPVYIKEGFAEERFGKGDKVPAYEHPRLLFRMEDLPRIRNSYTNTTEGNNKFSFLEQYTHTHFRERFANDELYPEIILPEVKINNDGGTGDGTVKWQEGSHIVAEAYEALMKADTKTARRLIDSMMRDAKVQIEVLNKLKGVTWQSAGHNILARRTTPILYDLLYNWMTPQERSTIRSIISQATAKNYTIGMYGLASSNGHTSNWQGWLVGELMLACASIYGEDGFDEEVFLASRRALELTAMLMGDPESGAAYEAMGKSQVYNVNYALLSHTQATGKKLIGSTMPYNYIRKFNFHIMTPWHSQLIYDGKLGGFSAIHAIGESLDVLHYAFPEDPIINYIKHASSAQGSKSYSQKQLRSYSQESTMLATPYVQDWKGPEDLDQHLQEAVEAAKEPKGYFSNYRGLMVSRNKWTPNTMQFYFSPRSTRGGHTWPSRGHFRVNALGRNWIGYEGLGTNHSKHHSVVTVDGESQSTVPGKTTYYEGAATQPGSIFDIMGCDLTQTYQHKYYKTFNEPLLHKIDQPWMDLEKKHMVHWYDSFKPGNSRNLPVDDIKIKQPYEYAYRSSLFARGKYAYSIIADDIKKDNQSRNYNWSFTVPRDIHESQSWKIDKNQIILSDPKDSSLKMLVSVFSHNSNNSFSSVIHKPENKEMKRDIYKMDFETQSPGVAFRTILYPFREGDPLPNIEYKDDKAIITIADQRDEISFNKQEDQSVKITANRITGETYKLRPLEVLNTTELESTKAKIEDNIETDTAKAEPTRISNKLNLDNKVLYTIIAAAVILLLLIFSLFRKKPQKKVATKKQNNQVRRAKKAAPKITSPAPTVTKANITLYINEENQGPYTKEQVQTALDNGDITADTWAYKEGDEDWVTVADILN